MVRSRELNPLPLFDEELLVAALQQAGVGKAHAFTIWRHILHSLADPEKGLQQMLDNKQIPTAAKEIVRSNQFALLTSRISKSSTSKDGLTTKLVVELQDKKLVESVIIRHEKETEAGLSRRVTLCVSSQVGCQMGCTFCATGTMGLRGNLTSGEILEQLVHANKIEKITNVVFMGMGEPLHNFDSVLLAIQAMVDPARFALRKTRVTLSTVGVVPNILRLTREAPFVTMALSLHAPTQELRSQIVPAAKNWKLDSLMAALDDHIERTGRRVLIEYVMLAGVNDSLLNAEELGELLQGKSVHLNLIPYNPTDVPIQYQPPTDEQIKSFIEVVRTKWGVFTTVRTEMGQDVSAACGQLALKQKEATGEGDVADCKSFGVGDIEDVLNQPAPVVRARRRNAAAGDSKSESKDTSSSSSSSEGKAGSKQQQDGKQSDNEQAAQAQQLAHNNAVPKALFMLAGGLSLFLAYSLLLS